MPVPVLIAARNEAEHIGESLAALSGQILPVEPIVIVNGCHDGTADIAIHAGATVLESEEGKMRALQAGLRYLGERALEPLLILDADSKPLFRGWSRQMVTNIIGLAKQRPAIAWGPYYFHGEINPVFGALITAASAQVSWADRNKMNPRTVRGGNTCLKLQDGNLLEAVLALDNYWPRADLAMYETIISNDAAKKVVFHPEAWIQTSGYRHSGILGKMIKRHLHPSKITDDFYASEAPTSSKPYFSQQP